MGMFDSVYLDIKCPHCGEISEIECQTKDTECFLDVWRKGDFIDKKYKYLDCIAGCKSDKCMEWSEKNAGYPSGFGRMFDVKVYLDDGVVSGEHEISI